MQLHSNNVCLNYEKAHVPGLTLDRNRIQKCKEKPVGKTFFCDGNMMMLTLHSTSIIAQSYDLEIHIQNTQFLLVACCILLFRRELNFNEILCGHHTQQKLVILTPQSDNSSDVFVTRVFRRTGLQFTYRHLFSLGHFFLLRSLSQVF